MGWFHILDRKHFTDKIALTWHNLDDHKKYRNDIHKTLDSLTIQEYHQHMIQAKKEYTTTKY